MGAWTFVEPYLEWVLTHAALPVSRPRYAGRPASAATATGLMSKHQAQFRLSSTRRSRREQRRARTYNGLRPRWEDDDGDRDPRSDPRRIRQRGHDRPLVQEARRAVKADEPLVELETDKVTGGQRARRRHARRHRRQGRRDRHAGRAARLHRRGRGSVPLRRPARSPPRRRRPRPAPPPTQTSAAGYGSHGEARPTARGAASPTPAVGDWPPSRRRSRRRRGQRQGRTRHERRHARRDPRACPALAARSARPGARALRAGRCARAKSACA